MQRLASSPAVAGCGSDCPAAIWRPLGVTTSSGRVSELGIECERSDPPQDSLGHLSRIDVIFAVGYPTLDLS